MRRKMNRTIQTLCLTMLVLRGTAGICLAAPGPPATPLAPQGSLGGAIYAAVIAGVAVVGFWKMRK